jgi:hypothetical protein
MESITLASLRTQVRQTADMVDSTFVSDSELNQFIDLSYAELYDILTATCEDYYTLPPINFTIPDGSKTYALPSDFYKLRGLDLSLGGGSNPEDWITVHPFQFNERNRKNSIVQRSLNSVNDINYRIIGDSLYFFPEDKAPGVYRLWYIPVRTKLTLDTDTMNGVQGFQQYVIVDAAIKCLRKEESDVQELLLAKADLKQRIEAMAPARDIGRPNRISDVTQGMLDRYYPYGW